MMNKGHTKLRNKSFMTWLAELHMPVRSILPTRIKTFSFCQFIAHTTLRPTLFHAAPNNRRALSRGDGVLHFLCT